MRKNVYNKIKYGLLNLFPKEHPNFYIDNIAMDIKYRKILKDGNSLYGEIELNKDNSIYFWIFKSRTLDPDIPVFDYTWDNVDKFLGDKDIDVIVNTLLSDETREVQDANII